MIQLSVPSQEEVSRLLSSEMKLGIKGRKSYKVVGCLGEGNSTLLLAGESLYWCRDFEASFVLSRIYCCTPRLIISKPPEEESSHLL